MKATPMIRKASGEEQPFSASKLKESLRRSGAPLNIIDMIANEIEKWLQEESTRLHKVTGRDAGIPSRAIYKRAFAMLRKETVSNAARYKLKNAMMEMGPTGYPFEYFTGEIYRLMGYDVEVGKVLDGRCVSHEVDVIATKGNHQRFVECKYYSSTGKNANVQVPLYIRSRVDDIIAKRSNQRQYDGFTFSGGIVTNTRFTADAEAYGLCAGLHLLSWDFPKGESIKDIIDRERIFPITSLTQLTAANKNALMEKGIVICRQLLGNKNALDSLGLSDKKRRKVLDELQDLCG
jgi:hypothetical protein